MNISYIDHSDEKARVGKPKESRNLSSKPDLRLGELSMSYLTKFEYRN